MSNQELIERARLASKYCPCGAGTCSLLDQLARALETERKKNTMLQIEHFGLERAHAAAVFQLKELQCPSSM